MDDNWSHYVIVPLLYVRFCGYDKIFYFDEAPEFIFQLVRHSDIIFSI